MSCISCLAVPKTTANRLIFASLPNNNNSAPPPPPLLPTQNNHKLGERRIKSSPLTTPKQQPSVAEVERAIGAGIFRDRDSRGSAEKPTLFDTLLSSAIGPAEGPVEKKLRETGEWILNSTEGPSRSAGHEILMVVCLGILPVWMFFLLVASGIIKLPFNIPFLDDLIM